MVSHRQGAAADQIEEQAQGASNRSVFVEFEMLLGSSTALANQTLRLIVAELHRNIHHTIVLLVTGVILVGLAFVAWTLTLLVIGAGVNALGLGLLPSACVLFLTNLLAIAALFLWRKRLSGKMGFPLTRQLLQEQAQKG